MNKKIIFMGSKDVGYECLKFLYNNQKKLDYEIVGVLTNDRGEKIKKYASLKKLKILNSLNEFLNIPKVDITISIQYHEILKTIHIEKSKDLIVNLHMAPLPEYRGSNQFSLAIIEDKEIFGTTIHKLESGIDSGDILFEDRFKIPKNCWVDNLYDITCLRSINLFKNSLKNIINLNINPIAQEELKIERGCGLYFKNQIQTLKKIDLSWDKNKIERYIRATSMHGFDPPFIEIDDKKIYLKTS